MHSQGGLGVGLALTRDLVGLHHGTITVQSEGPELGSTFTIPFPYWTLGSLRYYAPFEILPGDSLESDVTLLRRTCKE